MGSFYFLNSWYLAGLVTIGIPFLLLLTRAQTLRITNFSSVFLLRSITEKAANVIQWKRLFLLSVRILMLACLTLAFTLPFFNRKGGFFGGRADKHVILILDRSYSMGYQEEGQTLFDRAKMRTSEILNQHRKGRILFSVYAFDTHLEPVLKQSSDRKKIAPALRDLKLSSRETSFSNLLAEMPEKIATEPGVPAQFYILSDFSMREVQLRSHFESLARAWCEACSSEFVVLQPKDYKNFAIQRIQLPPRFFLPQSEEEIKVLYQSAGMAGKEVSVKLWMDTTAVAEQKIKVPESGKGVVSFRQNFPATGFFPIRIESEADALPADNVRYSLVPVHEPIRILVIQNREYDYPFENPYFYFSQVLESSLDASSKPWVEIAKSHSEALGNGKLGQYHMIVAADVPSLDSKALTQLRYYLKEGGTVLYALGKNFESRDALGSNYLIQFLGGNFGEMMQSKEEKPIRIASADYQHPLFRVFDKGRRGHFGEVEFSKAIPLIPQEKTGFQVLAWYGSQMPALLEMQKDKGRLLFWTSSLNTDWNDFPKNPLFVPFVFEMMKYAVLRHSAQPPALLPGETLNLAGSEDLSKPVTLKNPAGEQLTIYRKDTGTTSVTVEQPGFYEWTEYVKEGVGKRWAIVNVNAEESKPHFLELQASEKPVSEALKPASAPPLGLNAKFFIYRPLLYAVLAFLMLEAWLANRFYKPQWI